MGGIKTLFFRMPQEERHKRQIYYHTSSLTHTPLLPLSILRSEEGKTQCRSAMCAFRRYNQFTEFSLTAQRIFLA